MKTKSLCFIGFIPDYEECFIQSINDIDWNISLFNPVSITNKILWFKYVPRIFQKIWHKKLIKDYILTYPDKNYLFRENRSILKIILEMLECKKIQQINGVLLLRDPVDIKHKIYPLLDKLRKYPIKILTFDPDDSQKFGFPLYKQFISVIDEMKDIEILYDFSFVGKNKGRKKQLYYLKTELQALGFHSYFDIRGGAYKNLDYISYLRHSLNAYCMVEILQQGQSGMTLRTIEALFYQRKLLTNNQQIVDEELYHPNNIMVFDGQTIDAGKLKMFMSLPLYTFPNEIKEEYTSKFVLDKIISM